MACIFHTACLAHFPPARRAQFKRQIVTLSTKRPIYWMQAEPRHDHEPQLRLTICRHGRIEQDWPLGHYHPHGAWLEWTSSHTSR